VSISSKTQSLITAANSVTGESRTDLTSAVQDLKDGYGQGGGEIIQQTKQIIQLDETRAIYLPYNKSYGGFRKVNSSFDALIINFTNITDYFRVVIKAKISSSSSFSNYPVLIGSSDENAGWGGWLFFDRTQAIWQFSSASGNRSAVAPFTTYDTWLYFCAVVKSNGDMLLKIYDDNGQVITSGSSSGAFNPRNNTSYYTTYFGREGQYGQGLTGNANLTETFFDIDGTFVWGEANSKTQNMGLEV